jgi:hypothetical protein
MCFACPEIEAEPGSETLCFVTNCSVEKSGKKGYVSRYLYRHAYVTHIRSVNKGVASFGIVFMEYPPSLGVAVLVLVVVVVCTGNYETLKRVRVSLKTLLRHLKSLHCLSSRRALKY